MQGFAGHFGGFSYYALIDDITFVCQQFAIGAEINIDDFSTFLSQSLGIVQRQLVLLVSYSEGIEDRNPAQKECWP